MTPAITICLVPQARSGPFVFHGPLPAMLDTAKSIGYTAVEIFPPDAQTLHTAGLKQLLSERSLKLAAVGTGAGMVIHKLSLTDPATHSQAIDFIKSIIDVAGQHAAPAIIGSMQGRHLDDQRAPALDLLASALATLGRHASQYNIPLLYEPLNRYETNLFNRQADAADFLRRRAIPNVKILADLFHMNIEEVCLGQALRDVGDLLGHIHFVDSNRRAAGLGHINYAPIVAALKDLNYTGYLSAEALPLPDPQTAASQTLKSIKTLFALPD